MNKQEAKIAIERLVDKYSKNIAKWENTSYNEMQARAHFIDGLFEALGWKISGLNTIDDNDVYVEHTLKTNTSKRFDFIFQIENKSQFIVEAKKPSESLDNPKHIFQAKTYGFLSKIPFVILTNFKELKIYDISTKPNFNQVKEDLIFSSTYDNYGKNFNYLWSNFSKDAVIKKSLVKLYTERRNELNIDLNDFDYTYILKRGEQLLDETFLNDLSNIRLLIAQNIIDQNKKLKLTSKELNDTTQRLIDIIIFIRFLEDNEIESNNILRNIIEKNDPNPLQLLMNECAFLNKKYNGLLFHEYKLFKSIKIDHSLFKQIVLSLYYPESPYNFNKFSIEILGQIFEQYLAEKIVVKSGNAILELKPELKKAGGIYFTPEYIVDFILDNTVSKKLEEDKLSKVFSQLKIIDFSCGSGIFLIKSYKRLIDYFESNSEKLNSKYYYKDEFQNSRLTMEAKKIILEKNIFGIDIDSQAIEVAKMSLYFKMLENFCEDKSPRPILPSLESNIICGNSIVGTNFFEYSEEIQVETIETINPFSWDESELGKFDVVVGNPPYLRIQLLEELFPNHYQEYIRSNYNFPIANFDLSVVFVEKGLSILKPNGILGYIIPNTVLKAKYGEKFREYFSNEKNISKLVHFNDCQVFNNSTTYTCLLFLDQKVNNEIDFLSIRNIDKEFIGQKKFIYVKQSILSDSGDSWNFSSSQIRDEFEFHLKQNSITIESLCDDNKIFVGLQPSVNDVFVLTKISETKNHIVCYSDATKQNHKLEKKLTKKMVKGSSNIFKYFIDTEKVLLFPYHNDHVSGKSELIDQTELKKIYPLTWKYLQLCKKILVRKPALNVPEFYKFIYKKNHLLFDNKKILLPSLCLGSRFYLDEIGEYYFTGSGEGGGGGYGLILNGDNKEFDYYNILGILNSSLMSAFIELNGSYKRGGYKGIDMNVIKKMPLPRINTKNQKSILNKIGINAKKLNSIVTKNPSTSLQRVIKQLEMDINTSVFELFNLKENKFIEYINELNKKDL